MNALGDTAYVQRKKKKAEFLGAFMHWQPAFLQREDAIWYAVNKT